MCVSDMLVFGVIMECYWCGLVVFVDIVVVGFGNFEVVICCYLIIMIVLVDVYGIGLCIGEVLLVVLQVCDGGEWIELKSICIDYMIILWESV